MLTVSFSVQCDKSQHLEIARNKRLKNRAPICTKREMEPWAVLCRMFGSRRSNWALAHFFLALPRFSAKGFWEKVCCFSLRAALEADSLNRVHPGTNGRNGYKWYLYAYSVSEPRAVSGFFDRTLMEKNDIKKCKVENLAARKYDFHLQILRGSSQGGCRSFCGAIYGWQDYFQIEN